MYRKQRKYKTNDICVIKKLYKQENTNDYILEMFFSFPKKVNKNQNLKKLLKDMDKEIICTSTPLSETSGIFETPTEARLKLTFTQLSLHTYNYETFINFHFNFIKPLFFSFTMFLYNE
jgi:hypothetical protein